MNLAAGFAFALLAWPCFAASMPRHQAALLGRALPARSARVLRALAWLAVLAALACAIAARGFAQGPVFWAVALMLTALAWTLSMTFRPRRALAATLLVAVTLGAAALAF